MTTAGGAGGSPPTGASLCAACTAWAGGPVAELFCGLATPNNEPDRRWRFTSRLILDGDRPSERAMALRDFTPSDSEQNPLTFANREAARTRFPAQRIRFGMYAPDDEADHLASASDLPADSCEVPALRS